MRSLSEMNRLRNSLAIGVACLVFATIPATVRADTVPCEKNFTVKDGLFDKKIYKTWQNLGALTQMMIYRRTYAYLVKDGWVINLTDKENGIISASQAEELSGGAGRAANLNILIENAGNYFGGLPSGRGLPGEYRLTMALSVPGGLHAHEDMVRKTFCDALEEIKGGTYGVN